MRANSYTCLLNDGVPLAENEHARMAVGRASASKVAKATFGEDAAVPQNFANVLFSHWHFSPPKVDTKRNETSDAETLDLARAYKNACETNSHKKTRFSSAMRASSERVIFQILK